MIQFCIFCFQIPSTLWNVADMPSLENMSKEQIEKLVKENVALQQVKPTVHQDLRSNSKHEDSIEDFKKRLNTSCPVHGIQDKTSFYDVKANPTLKFDKKSDSSKEISTEIGGITKDGDGKVIVDGKMSVGDVTEDKTDGFKDKSHVTKDKTDVIKDVDRELKEIKTADESTITAENKMAADRKVIEEIKMAVDRKMIIDRKMAVESKMAAECSDSDTDDELSPDKVGAIMSSIAGSGGYMGRPCTCTANNPMAAIRSSGAPKMSEGDVYEAVSGFVPYNLITQHSIPGKIF